MHTNVATAQISAWDSAENKIILYKIFYMNRVIKAIESNTEQPTKILIKFFGWLSLYGLIAWDFLLLTLIIIIIKYTHS